MITTVRACSAHALASAWTAAREEQLLGRPLHEDKSHYFAQIVRRISGVLLLGPALDASYHASFPLPPGFLANRLRFR